MDQRFIQLPLKAETVIILMLQMKTWGLDKTNDLSQDHIGNQKQSLDLNPRMHGARNIS